MDYDVLRRNFEGHGFRTVYCGTKEEAVAFLCSENEGKTVAFGGSMTLKEMGLEERLAEKNRVIWHWNEAGRETLLKAREAEVYITSANGVSETGELVNIDGTGNRVSMMVFGPQKLYFVVGRNKVEPDLHRALFRAKNVAAPRNAVRLGVSTPCAVNHGDKCYDCNSPQRICGSTVLMERPSKGMETVVIFVDEDLGY